MSTRKDQRFQQGSRRSSVLKHLLDTCNHFFDLFWRIGNYPVEKHIKFQMHLTDKFLLSVNPFPFKLKKFNSHTSSKPSIPRLQKL
ncbi:hypothetical protein TW79_07070 [Tritonibacter mobilis]|uniref:Uncharacterized protein n=1 Tax=Tritonibacter mobilis F1926 TaxID=1265309 RepID=A0A1B1A0X7_9RHOB|nr:hypothetical protein K529_005535 [Tritonibacter mobilis F1926]KJZ25405.1 hypothetical protein TW79_07070 [Tritonibacter mobilis]